MYGLPPQGQLQGYTCDNSNTRFFTLKRGHIYMCSYIISRKPIGQLQSRMKVERLLVYINPVVRYVTIGVLNYGYGTTSVGSR